MYPNSRDVDSFASPCKRTNLAKTKNTCSQDLLGYQYGEVKPRVTTNRKMTPAKRAELGGSNPVEHFSQRQLSAQNLHIPASRRKTMVQIQTGNNGRN